MQNEIGIEIGMLRRKIQSGNRWNWIQMSREERNAYTDKMEKNGIVKICRENKPGGKRRIKKLKANFHLVQRTIRGLVLWEEDDVQVLLFLSLIGLLQLFCYSTSVLATFRTKNKPQLRPNHIITVLTRSVTILLPTCGYLSPKLRIEFMECIKS